MVEKTFKAKDIIFREGDQSDCAYIIQSGTVDVLKHADHGEVPLAKLEKGAVLGEMGLFDPKAPRSATARATTDVVVDVLDEKEFHALIEQCPPRLLPIVRTVFDRLRASNTRISQVEKSTVILDTDIERIVLNGGGELEGQVTNVAIPVVRLPFRVGGFPKGGEVNRMDQNHLNIPSDGPPLIVSRQHCQIAVENGGIYAVDLGSRFCTWVNGRQIGRGRGSYSEPLKMGKNEITLGSPDSPYRLTVTCE